MAGKTRSAHQGGLYKAYQASGRMMANRKKKLERALKRNPENTQIETALKTIGYRRKTPKTSVWSKQSKAWAKMQKDFAKPSAVVIPKVSEKEMFRLRARAGASWNT
jgi:hypothetical protein